tara:strand:- start:149 stop:1045 length:897 start_codon:yes stop_codon:yes gene_type:complete
MKKIKQAFEHKYYWYKVENLLKKHFFTGSKTNSIVLASTAKSGNTFFRFVWLNIIFLNERAQDSVNFVKLDRYLPFEGFLDDIKKEWVFNTLPCLLKTHRATPKFFNPLESIHLFRNPLDTMISQYHYNSNRISGAKELSTSIEKKIFHEHAVRFKGTFSEYLRNNIELYCQHFSLWMNNGRSIPISYEMLMSDRGSRHYKRVLQELGFDINEKIINEAMQRSLPKNLKNSPPSNKMSQLGNMKFIRNASTEQFKENGYYSKSDIELVKSVLKKYDMHNFNIFPVEYRKILEMHPWII